MCVLNPKVANLLMVKPLDLKIYLHPNLVVKCSTNYRLELSSKNNDSSLLSKLKYYKAVQLYSRLSKCINRLSKLILVYRSPLSSSMSEWTKDKLLPLLSNQIF